MIAEGPDNEMTSLEYWKTRCNALQRQTNALQQRNSSLSKQFEESHFENLELARVVQSLTDKLKLVQVTNDAAENNDLFYTFPEEVWPFILTYINNSVDLLHLCNASPLLETVILHQDKSRWLFDQILPIIFKWLTEKEVLLCRLVCRMWNQAVDKYLDSYHSPYTSRSQNTPTIWRTKLEPVDFDNTTTLSQLVEEAKDHQKKYGRNLLMTRSLKLGLDLESDLNINNGFNTFWESAVSLVRVIGRDLWHIEIYNDGFEEEPASFYGLFHQLLCYLPNLKTLRLICEFETRRNPDQDNLIYRLGTWPLPSLPYLESLHVLHKMPVVMTSAIVASYARQIRKFVVSVAILMQVDQEYLRGLVNLSKLVLRDCAKDLQEFHGILQLLERLELPNLEKLRLFRSYSDEEVISTSYLFRLIVSNFPRLRILDTYRMEVIVEPGADHDDEGNNCFVYNLRTLKIRNNSKLTFDFLLKLPFLEELYIRDESNPNPTVHQVGCNSAMITEDDAAKPAIDIPQFLYKGKMYESTIWKVMPLLKLVVYESFDERVIPSGRYTRDMYDYLLKKATIQAKKECN